MAEQDTWQNSTSKLLHKLFNSPDLEIFLRGNEKYMEIPPFHEYITSICQITGQVPEQIIKQSAIERTYGHQLFNGTRKPSRDKVIQLAIGFQMDYGKTQKLLKAAQKSPLYPKIKRDAAIIYCIVHNKDIYETQAVLQGLELTLLSGNRL